MKRRFKAKKKMNKFILGILVFIFIVLLIVILSFNSVYNFTIKKLSDFEHININLKNNKELPKDGLSFIVNYSLGFTPKKNIEEPPAIKTNNEIIENKVEPIIYIYNTHQTEEYKKTNNKEYNVTPTVLHASLIFQSKLKELGIESIVEKESIIDLLNLNNWNYKNSYKASKMLAKNTIDTNSSIKYIIDLHRDSIPENIATTTIDNKNYAKIMLVLGTGHENYERNHEMALRINNYLNEFNPTITRGIDIKKNSGIYNQDLMNTAVLIEVGGPYNDIESVKNSLEILANVYQKIIGEDNEKKET